MSRILRRLFLSMAAFGILLLEGCGPVLDPNLSPPIIDKPIYNCAETIAFSGAERDAKIVVYVNGAKVIQVPIWMGWGSIKLPSSLHTGDIVSAAQIVGNRISEKSRDPVKVTTIPASVAPGGKLPTPTVVSPLYECQEVVLVNGVVQGATVTLRQNGATTWDTMTPYTIARFGVTKLKVPDSYDAMESLCKDPLQKSDWSIKANVGPRPPSLATPTIGKPLVANSDAMLLTGLVPGALVEIFAVSGSGTTVVGSGAALDTATIFYINPPIDLASNYKAVQALCDLKSPPNGTVTPVKDPPAPSVQGPLCQGGKYVTVCDTAVLSTVKVTMDGARIAGGAGNGGCVTFGLGDTQVLQTGKKVRAVQEITGNPTPSPPSADVIVTAGGAPSYNPGPWNTPAHQSKNNCYNYSTNIMTDTYAQPGRAHGVFPPTTCAGTGSGAVADGLVLSPEKRCTGCSHVVALVISPGVSGGQPCGTDYHWYRLDDNGRWSNKPGPSPATDQDASGNPITNPETANRKYVGPDYCLDYSIFCTYYCVDKSVVVIQ